MEIQMSKINSKKQQLQNLCKLHRLQVDYLKKNIKRGNIPKSTSGPNSILCFTKFLITHNLHFIEIGPDEIS